MICRIVSHISVSVFGFFFFTVAQTNTRERFQMKKIFTHPPSEHHEAMDLEKIIVQISNAIVPVVQVHPTRFVHSGGTTKRKARQSEPSTWGCFWQLKPKPNQSRPFPSASPPHHQSERVRACVRKLYIYVNVVLVQLIHNTYKKNRMQVRQITTPVFTHSDSNQVP